MRKTGGTPKDKDHPRVAAPETKGTTVKDKVNVLKELKETSEHDASSEEERRLLGLAPVSAGKDKDKMKGSTVPGPSGAAEEEEIPSEHPSAIGDGDDREDREDKDKDLKVKNKVEKGFDIRSESVLEDDLESQHRSASQYGDMDDPTIWFDEELHRLLRSKVKEGILPRDVFDAITIFPPSSHLKDKGTYENAVPPLESKVLIENIKFISDKDIDALAEKYSFEGPQNANFWSDFDRLFLKSTGYSSTIAFSSPRQFILSTGAVPYPSNSANRGARKLKFSGAALSAEPKGNGKGNESQKMAFAQRSENIDEEVLSIIVEFLSDFVETMIVGAVEVPRLIMESLVVYMKLNDVAKVALHKVAIYFSHGLLAGAANAEIQIRAILESPEPIIDQKTFIDALSLFAHAKGWHATDARLAKEVVMTVNGGVYGVVTRTVVKELGSICLQDHADPAASLAQAMQKFKGLMDSLPDAETFLQDKDKFFVQLIIGSISELHHDADVLEALRSKVVSVVLADPKVVTVHKLIQLFTDLTKMGALHRSARFKDKEIKDKRLGYADVAQNASNERNAFRATATQGEQENEEDWGGQAYASQSVAYGKSSRGQGSPAQKFRGQGSSTQSSRGQSSSAQSSSGQGSIEKKYNLNDLSKDELVIRITTQWSRLHSTLDTHPDKDLLRTFADTYTEKVNYNGKLLRRFKMNSEGYPVRIESALFAMLASIIKKQGAPVKIILQFQDTCQSDFVKSLPIVDQVKAKGLFSAQKSGGRVPQKVIKGGKGEGKVKGDKSGKGSKGSVYAMTGGHQLPTYEEYCAQQMLLESETEEERIARLTEEQRAQFKIWYQEQKHVEEIHQPGINGEYVEGEWVKYTFEGSDGEEDAEEEYDLDGGGAEQFGRAYPVVRHHVPSGYLEEPQPVKYNSWGAEEAAYQARANALELQLQQEKCAFEERQLKHQALSSVNGGHSGKPSLSS